MPIRSNEQRKQRTDCEIEQPQHQLPYQLPYGNQQQQPMQYLNMSQFSPYQQSLMAPNIVIMPVMNSSADPSGAVTHSLPQSNPVMSQAGQLGSQNSQISLLLSPAAFFSMSNTAANQTVTTSHDAGIGAGGGLIGNGTTTTPAVRSPALPSHGSNLPKLLPKPQQPMIMPRTMPFPSALQHQHQAHHSAQQQHHHQQQQLHQHQQQQQQQFKRPTNRKTSVKSRSSSSRPSKSSASTATKKDNCSNKDNVAVAWEIAEQSGAIEEVQTSFVTDLARGNADEFCLLPPGSDGLDRLFCTNSSGDSQQTHEFDELLEELVTMSWGVVRQAHVGVQETVFECAIGRLDPVRYNRAAVALGSGPCAIATVSRQAMVASHSVVVARQPPITDLSLSTAAVAARSNVDSQRVMQLLYAHLGRHSATLLSPLLKCLLPTSAATSNGHVEQGPLSVCTRLSEQDELTEDDLLADISPVKRDPAQLANLDRFLESCQSITPCSSLQDYEEEPQLLLSSFAADDDDDDQQQHQLQQHPHLSPLLPFQAGSEDSLTLQEFCGNHSASWLRKSKQRSKWALNGTMVRFSKALEVPQLAADCNATDNVEKTVLRKKSTFKQLGRPIRRPTGATRKALKYVARLQREEALPVTAVESTDDTTDAGTSSGCLKMRIRLSQLRVVASTVVRSPEPPPPIPETCHEPNSRNETIVAVSTAPVPQQKPKPHQHQQRQLKKHAELSTKRIFCTRKEDRRSSALNVTTSASNSSASPVKQHRRQQPPQQSPCKSKRPKRPPPPPPVIEQPQQPQQHPPLILKLSTVKRAVVEPPASAGVATSGSLKLRLKRSQDYGYSHQATQQQQHQHQKQHQHQLQMEPPDPPIAAIADALTNSNSYEFNPTVTLAPPPVHHRMRPQLAAALQFSPAHSSSDSDVDGAHNEISSLLQRQEAAAIIGIGGGGGAGPGGAGGSATGDGLHAQQHHHHHNASAFPQLIPVPYLVGSDPTVFIDPHECDLVIVKNSRYKKVTQRGEHHPQATTRDMDALLPSVDVVAATDADGGNGTGNGNGGGNGNAGNNNGNELLFVPGCFVEQQDKSHHLPSAWSHSSPSMPVLAPQEPFSSSLNGDGGKAAHIAVAYEYG